MHVMFILNRPILHLITANGKGYFCIHNCVWGCMCVGVCGGGLCGGGYGCVCVCVAGWVRVCDCVYVKLLDLIDHDIPKCFRLCSLWPLHGLQGF